MALRAQSRLWRRCRTAFRWFRIGLLLLILALLGALIYVNQVGLPEFVKKPLLERLRARGLDLQFTRLRWRWYRGIVAENVYFGRADEPLSPRLALKEVQVRLNYRALVKLRLQVDSLALRQGHLIWPIATTNQPPRELSVENIQAELRLLPDDVWDLDHFQAQFAGGKIQLAGSVTNASAVHEWKFIRARQPAPGALQTRLREFADALDQTHFSAPPELRVDIRGDARKLRSFTVRLTLRAPAATTPWGTIRQGLFSVQLSPVANRELGRAEIKLQADQARTPWADASDLGLKLQLAPDENQTNVVAADLNLSAAHAETKWGRAGALNLSAQWSHSLTNALPLSGRGELRLDEPETKLGRAKTLQFTGKLAGPRDATVPVDESWAWWTNLAPYALDWECRVSGLQSPKLAVDEFFGAGQWRAPELQAAQISASLYGGKLDAQARLNVATRELGFAGSSDFDAQKISALLTEKSRHWLSEYSWEKPPALKAQGALILPAWTNRQPDWRAEVQPTVRLQGQFHIENGAFRGVPAASADSHFSYLNLVWRLPDLVVIRPEGRLDLAYEENDRTKDYYFRVHSLIDLRAARPLLEPKEQRGLDYVAFTQPPIINGEVWGRWHERERTGVKARVTLANFTFRGESADRFQTDLEYTNQFLKLLEPRLDRGTQLLSAASAVVDFAAEKVYLTNGFSTAEPLAVARAIGPHVVRAIEPYRFLQPPTVRVDGTVPIHDESEADLHFTVGGGPFEWWRFTVPRISGQADWVGERLTLKEVQAQFYRGAATGNAEFDFHPRHGADFHFDAVVTNADLHLVAADLAAKTNRLEGLLTAQLSITHGNSADWQSWQGKGRVHLRDGLIWEIPIFGILSPVLDSIIPGLGSSRAGEGSASFVITNGVVRSDDLAIRAATMRLHYWGTLDLKGNVDAHAEAELLRDTWMVGRLLSLALWPVSKIFEYKITGTLRQPRSEPVFFVPRILMMPFHPLRTMKELIPEPPDSTSTNAPPAPSR